jgi:hypothetical protein
LETQPADQQKKREELLELYKLALEDYRFQVQLNWGRSQYFLVLNIGIIGIATGIVQVAQGGISILVAGIYLAGIAFCLFAIVALRVQRKYYISAREQKKRFEEELELGDLSVTPVGRSDKTLRRFITFKSFVNIMLGGLALLNLLGMIYVIAQNY